MFETLVNRNLFYNVDRDYFFFVSFQRIGVVINMGEMLELEKSFTVFSQLLPGHCITIIVISYQRVLFLTTPPQKLA